MAPKWAPDDVAPSRQIRPSDGHVPIVLVLELDPPFYAAYRAVVEREGRQIWQGRGLELGERDTLTLSLDPRLLTPGDYLLRLLAASPEGGGEVEAGRFTFRILAP